MNKKLILISLILYILVLITCTQLKKEILVSTGEVTSIASNSAEASGQIIDLGEGAINFGHCWAAVPNVTLSASKTQLGIPAGATVYTSPLTNLLAGTKYYIKSYISDGAQTVYGKELTFTTAAATLPTLTTTTITAITTSGASGGGNITDEGGAPVTARGICWNISTGPLTINSKTSDGIGLGNFTSSITTLTAGTLYYVKAYATNSAGTGYGNEITFTSAAPLLPTVLTTAISGVTQTGALSGGNITSDGGAVVTARGICWNTLPTPTIANNKTSDGISLGTFGSSLTGLNPGKTYYVRSYATNATGTAYGNELSFSTNSGAPTLTTTAATSISETTAISGGNISDDGGASVIARGICLGISSNPTLSNSTVIDGNGGTGIFISNLVGLIPNTLYYLRSFATNSAGTSYGLQITFTTNAVVIVIPTLATTSVTSITQTTATGGGNITSNGGSSITVSGVCWSTTTIPVVTGGHTTDGAVSGIYTSSITGLTGGTTYYVRAYAINSAGTAYGSELTFTTTSTVTVPGVPIIGTATPGNALAAVTFSAPVSNGGSVITTYTVTSSPGGLTAAGAASPITVTGLTNGTAYTFTATATNAIGNSAASTASNSVTPAVPITVPGVPSIGEATAGNAQSIVSFTAPVSNGGSVITGYTVTSSPGGLTAAGAASPIIVTGLTNGTAYTFNVTATNIIGTSPASYASNSVTPSAPSTVTDIDGNVYNTVIIGTQTWMASNLITTKYRNGDLIGTTSPSTLDISGESTPKYQWASGGNESNVATYGRLYTWYAVTDNRIVCPAGWHMPSDAEWTTLLDFLTNNGYGYQGSGNDIGKSLAAKSGWPINPTPGNIGNDQGSNNGSGFTALPAGQNYDGGFDITNGTWWSLTEYNATSSWYRGLEVWDAIVYRNLGHKPHGISVRCVKGEGPLSPVVTTTTVSSIAQSTATSGGNISNDGGSAVTARGVCWSTTTNPTISGSKTADGTGTGTFTSSLTGLTSGTYYYVKAYATNSVGTAYGSEFTFTTSTITVSGAPTIGTATAGNAQATVSFTAPVSNGGSAITVYTVTSSPGSLTGTGSVSPITVTGLINETAYTFTITATNATGNSAASSASNSVTPLASSIITDIDGNVYNLVTIGTQTWMGSNLKTTKFNDGSAILNITVDGTWAAATTGAYCDYSNTPGNSAIYGRLYNWYTVDNNASTKAASNGGKNVCPTGWHVPTDSEWTSLTTYLGGESVAGGKLKETGTTHWITTNLGATNVTGFTALPGGFRGLNGSYGGVENYGYWWSSSEGSATNAYDRSMINVYSMVSRDYNYKVVGISVRCVRDL